MKLAYVTNVNGIKDVYEFCRAVYLRAFGLVEGEARLKTLSYVDALNMWQEGLPDSNPKGDQRPFRRNELAKRNLRCLVDTNRSVS